MRHFFKAFCILFFVIMETDRQLGLAHFMEHMNFNGTKNFEKNDLVDYLQSIGVKFGADLNAYTSFDETVYILPIPSDDPEKLEKGFQILEDWAHNTTLSEEAIDGERETWYRPDLMAVVAVGDLDIETMEKKIKDHFSEIPKAVNPTKREAYELPNHDETFIAIASDKEAAFSRIQVMYKDRYEAPEVKTVSDYRESLVKNLFSTLINNRLGELRNSANPPFVFGFSYYGGTYARTKNAYQSIANTSPEGQLQGLRAILEEE